VLTAIAILLAIFVLPAPWGVVAIVVGAMLDLGETLFFWSRWRGRRARVGVETFVGRTAVAIGQLAPEGQVKLDGELWHARAEATIESGGEVVVRAVEGLTLVVEPTR
jgi:membrane protein implicated in regulation of membrane protease activity